MSAIRKIVVSVVTALFLCTTGMVVASGTASAECDWNSPVPC